MALEALVALESGLEEFYQLRRPLFEGDVSEESSLALVIMKRQGGLLVAAPFMFLSSEDKAAINLLGDKSAIGPRTMLTVPAEKEIEGGGREAASDIDVLVFDMDVSVAGQLVPLREVSEEEQEIMMGLVEEDSHIVPMSDALLKFAAEWVELEASGNLAYYSAVEEQDEAVPETPKAPGKERKPREPKEPKGDKAKRVTTAMLSDQLSGLLDVLPQLSNQVLALQEDQQKLRQEFLLNAGAPPVRPSQVPISAGVHQLATPAALAQALGGPPRVKNAPALVPNGVVPKMPLKKGTDSQLNVQEQAEEIEEPGSVLASAVLEQSKALTTLVSHLQQGGDPLLWGQADSSGLSLSSKGTAQRERLQLQLASRSGGFCLAVLQNAVRKMKPSAKMPQSLEEAALTDFSMLTYLERYGGYGASKELGLIQYAVAHIFDAAVHGDLAGVQELTSLLTVGLEQAAMDGGRLEFAYKLMLLEEPPSQLWSYRQAAYDPRSRAFSPLCPQRWATCALAFSKEVDYIQAKRQEVAVKKAAAPPTQPGPKKKKFPKAKASPHSAHEEA